MICFFVSLVAELAKMVNWRNKLKNDFTYLRLKLSLVYAYYYTPLLLLILVRTLTLTPVPGSDWGSNLRASGFCAELPLPP